MSTRNQATSIHQLATVHTLLSAERRAAEHDIVITTALEILAHGPKNLADLVAGLNSVWPAAELGQHQILTSLDTARATGLICDVETLEGSAYALTSTSTADIQGSAAWAHDVIDALASQIRERAREGYSPITSAEALLWADLLGRSLFRGIANAHHVFMGDLSVLPDNTLVPRHYDVESMISVVADAHLTPEVGEFLQTLILSAIDPSDPFANALVSDISTCFVLHAFLARRDYLAGRELIGSLAGQQIILDTPILLRMLAPGRQAEAIKQAITEAVRVEVLVQIPSHVMEELLGVVRRVGRDYAAQVDDAVQRGASLASLQTTVDDEVLGFWLAGLQAGTYHSWVDFERAAERMGFALEKLGAKIGPHENEDDADRVEECRRSLVAVLERRKVDRGKSQIKRDANTMAMAWRTRRNGPGGDAFWPAAWVITSDRSMSPAYSRLVSTDHATLTLHPAQWVEVVSACCDPASLEGLARSTAELVSYDTLFSVARKYPPNVAIELALTLRPEAGASSTDIRLTQLCLDDVLDNTLDFVRDPRGSAAKIAGAVLARRSTRMAEGHRRTTEAANTAILEAQKKEEKASLELEIEREQKNALQERIVHIETSHEPKSESDRIDYEDRLSRIKRIYFALAVAFVVLVSVALLSAYGYYWIAAGTTVVLLVFLLKAYAWVTDLSKQWHGLLIALAGEAIPLLQGLVSTLRQ